MFLELHFVFSQRTISILYGIPSGILSEIHLPSFLITEHRARNSYLQKNENVNV